MRNPDRHLGAVADCAHPQIGYVLTDERVALQWECLDCGKAFVNWAHVHVCTDSGYSYAFDVGFITW